MTSFMICLILMSVYCNAQEYLNFAAPWPYDRSDVSQGNQQANGYRGNNFHSYTSSAATSSNRGNAASSSTRYSGYDANGTYYERDVVETTIGNTLHHHERIYLPSVDTTRIIHWTIDLTNPNSQPVLEENYIVPR